MKYTFLYSQYNCIITSVSKHRQSNVSAQKSVTSETSWGNLNWSPLPKITKISKTWASTVSVSDIVKLILGHVFLDTAFARRYSN